MYEILDIFFSQLANLLTPFLPFLLVISQLPLIVIGVRSRLPDDDSLLRDKIRRDMFHLALVSPIGGFFLGLFGIKFFYSSTSSNLFCLPFSIIGTLIGYELTYLGAVSRAIRRKRNRRK